MVVRLKPSFLDVAIIVLERAQQPMTCPQIIRAARRDGLLVSTAKTPENTLYASITRSIANDPSTPFRKLAKGLFDLKGTIYDKPTVKTLSRAQGRG